MKRFLKACFVVVLALGLFYWVEPYNLVIVEDAGYILDVKKVCESSGSYIKQNGERTLISLPKECHNLIVIKWCKMPSRNKGCAIDLVNDGDTLPLFGNYHEKYEKYLTSQKDKIKQGKHAYSFMTFYFFEPQDKISVAYLEGAWFKQKSSTKPIMLFKWLENK